MSNPIVHLSGARCLVTGGAGFVGSHLADAILAAGGRVRVVDNFSTGNRSNLAHLAGRDDVEIVRADVSDAAVADDSVAGVDYVFHQAAMASVPRSMREPTLCHAWCATSTVNLLRAGAEHGIKRFVLAATSAAYGNSSFVAKRESDPAEPLSPYAAAKLAAEQYCRAFHAGFDLPTVVLRYFNVFGPRQDPQSEYSAVIPRFVSMILAGEQPIIYGDGGQSRDFIYVADVARANLLAATVDAAVGGTFNIGRGGRTTLLELLSTLGELLDRDIHPTHQPPRPGDVRDSQADISEARARLSFEPTVTMSEALARSIEYYRSPLQTTSAAI